MAMKQKYIDVGDGDWGIVICYDYTLYDFDDLWAYMRSFGLSDRKANEALRILTEPNTAMCISNNDVRMSLVLISESYGVRQFLNSLQHELKHASDAIIEYYDVDWDSEDAAYLAGHLMQRALEAIDMDCTM